MPIDWLIGESLSKVLGFAGVVFIVWVYIAVYRYEKKHNFWESKKKK